MSFYKVKNSRAKACTACCEELLEFYGYSHLVEYDGKTLNKYRRVPEGSIVKAYES